MSEEILKVFLHDMLTVRIVCLGCQSVIEMNMDQLKARFRDCCPVCAKPFVPPIVKTGVPVVNPLHELENVFRAIAVAQTQNQFTVEFPVKIKNDPQP
jgi:hypothetical protein